MKGPASVWQQSKQIKLCSVSLTFKGAADALTLDGPLDQKAVRKLYVCFLRGFAVGAGDGFNPTAERNDAERGPGRDFLSVTPPDCVSSSCCRRRCCSTPSPADCLLCSLLPERPGALVPLALQWRMNSPDAC